MLSKDDRQISLSFYHFRGGVSIEFGRIFLQFWAFITVKHSFRVLNPENYPLNTPMLYRIISRLN